VLRAVQVWQTKAASAPVDLDGTAQILLTTLEVNLSPQGFASLVALLRTEKKHMKIAPVPDMSGHKH